MDKVYGQCYEELYRRHWWWRARESILLDVIRSLSLRDPIEILDVGCGNGLFFAELDKFGRVCGIEVDESLLRGNGPYRDRIFSEPLGHERYRDLRFDLITALDVIEHLEDDRGAIEQMVAMLRPGGRLLVTVPASMLLWDMHDEVNRHYRRYSMRALKELAPDNARILRLGYLFHVLFFPKLLVRGINVCFGRRLPQHSIPPRPVNWIMKTLGLVEYRLFHRLRIPFGTSLLVVLERLPV